MMRRKAQGSCNRLRAHFASHTLLPRHRLPILFCKAVAVNGGAAGMDDEPRHAGRRAFVVYFGRLNWRVRAQRVKPANLRKSSGDVVRWTPAASTEAMAFCDTSSSSGRSTPLLTRMWLRRPVRG